MGELLQNLTLRQEQVLSLQMIQRLELLQMTSHELQEYVERIALENPVIEVDSHRISCRINASSAAEGDRETPLWDGGQLQARPSLQEHLREQLPLAFRDNLTEFLLQSLDENGWLSEPLSYLSELSGYSLRQLKERVTILQGLDPAGVCAGNLAESFLLQLYREPVLDNLAIKIVSQNLDDVAYNRIRKLSCSLYEKPDEVQRAVAHIRRLNPRPANGFSTGETTKFISPDIIISCSDESIYTVSNELYSPELHLNPYYVKLLEQNSDADVQQYLKEKIAQAQWLMQALRSREETLRRCVKTILLLQPDLPRNGYLRPMTMADVACRMNVHPSTVSRAVRGKYIQIADRVLPMQELFSRAVSASAAADLSAADIKAIIRQLITEEDPGKPLSDQQLCCILEQRGCSVARRTVAKYRSALGILPAASRAVIG